MANSAWELALELAEGSFSIDAATHVPGIAHEIADMLSRKYDPDKLFVLPPALAHLAETEAKVAELNDMLESLTLDKEQLDKLLADCSNINGVLQSAPANAAMALREAAGRIEIGLYGNHVPKTVKNFATLCAGDSGEGVMPLTFNLYGEPSAPVIDTVTPLSASQLEVGYSSPADTGGDLIEKYLVEYTANTSVNAWTANEANITFSISNIAGNDSYGFWRLTLKSYMAPRNLASTKALASVADSSALMRLRRSVSAASNRRPPPSPTPPGALLSRKSRSKSGSNLGMGMSGTPEVRDLGSSNSIGRSGKSGMSSAGSPVSPPSPIPSPPSPAAGGLFGRVRAPPSPPPRAPPRAPPGARPARVSSSSAAKRAERVSPSADAHERMNCCDCGCLPSHHSPTFSCHSAK